MTTFTIATENFRHQVGFEVMLLTDRLGVLRGIVERVSPHELLVRVGGRALAFQEVDGEGKGWTWRE